MTDRRQGTRKSGILIAALCTALLLPPQALAAGTDWLKLGQDLLGGGTQGAPASGLSSAQVGAGLKEALHVGSERVVAQLGAVDGFNADTTIHIPLPAGLGKVRSALGAVGMSGMLDDLELKLNRAAEVATPKAKKLFWQAIEQMTLDDAMGIYNGPQDAATRYFEGKMSEPLAREMRPVVDSCLAEVGAVQAYDAVMGQYRSIPFVPDVKADLSSHVVEKGMAGIFHYLAKEEAAIRQNPAKRTTELLRTVFGAK